MPSSESMQIAEKWTRDNALTMTPKRDDLARAIDELRVRDLEKLLKHRWDSDTVTACEDLLAALRSTIGDKR